MGRANHVELAAENNDQGTNHEHAETEKVGGPEVDIQLHVRSGEKGERTEVDASVEDHVDTLNGQGGVDDHALPLLGGGDGHLLPLVLIGNQRSHVTLDTTGTQTDDQDGDNETTDTRAVIQGRRDGGTDEDEQTNHVDDTEQHNGLVLAEVLIGDDGTEDGSNITPELEEGSETGSTLVIHTERTTSLTTIPRSLDVVLEQTRHSVVGETLAQLDDSHQPGGEGQVLCDMAQGGLLRESGFAAIRSNLVLLVQIGIHSLFIQDNMLGDLLVIVRSSKDRISCTLGASRQKETYAGVSISRSVDAMATRPDYAFFFSRGQGKRSQIGIERKRSRKKKGRE